jgi:rieske iron-sulfur protein
MTNPPTTRSLAGRRINRRRLLEGAVASGIGLKITAGVAKTDDPRKFPPQLHDDLAFPSWENEGRTISISDVPLGGPPILAYPRDPSSGVAREKSRLNQILLLRFDETELSEETKLNAVDGLVAYSGVCTHTGCSVTEWDVDARNLLCPCHASQFDPRMRAIAVGGPASRALPILPLALADKHLKVAGPFRGRVGAKKK